MSVNLSPSDSARIEKAVSVLLRDGLVVYPTETVYGLGADALSEPAVLKVFEAKQRLLGKPISVAVSDLEMIYGIAYVDEFAEEFIDRFLPGPVTVVLPVKNSLPGVNYDIAKPQNGIEPAPNLTKRWAQIMTDTQEK